MTNNLKPDSYFGVRVSGRYVLISDSMGPMHAMTTREARRIADALIAAANDLDFCGPDLDTVMMLRFDNADEANEALALLERAAGTIVGHVRDYVIAHGKDAGAISATAHGLFDKSTK